MDFEQAVQQMYEANKAIARGDPEPAKALYSIADDVTLANPWGRAVRGRSAVCDMLDFVGARFRDGTIESVERVAAYVGSDIVTTMENERWIAKVGGREELVPFELRVTCTYRREDGAWKLVSRHADPINTPRPDGPLT